MIEKVNLIVFPEGDTQSIDRPVRMNEMVDINGRPLILPLATSRVIAYRVRKIETRQTRNEEIREHYLELVRSDELEEFVRR